MSIKMSQTEPQEQSIEMKAIHAPFIALMILLLGLNANAQTTSENGSCPPIFVNDLMKMESVINPENAWNGRGKTTIPVRLNGKNVPESISVAPDHPNGIRVSAQFPDEVVVRLPVYWSQTFGGVDQLGFINDGYCLQVMGSDMDGDGSDEILVGVSDGMIDTNIHVLKYHPPLYAVDVGRPENWSLAGIVQGQGVAKVKGNSILFRLGGTGRVTEYLMVREKMIEIK